MISGDTEPDDEPAPRSVPSPTPSPSTESPPPIDPIFLDTLIAHLDRLEKLGESSQRADPVLLESTEIRDSTALFRDLREYLRLMSEAWPRLGNAEGPDQGLRYIGRFELISELGRGGFGIVYKAFDPLLKRYVALKVPRIEGLALPELRRRFLREARAAGALEHPNIVPVFEAGEDGPLCYLAAAYVEGPTLSDWLKSRTTPVSPREAATMLATMADAVHHAHTRGVLHRDLKPGNVLLQGGGRVRWSGRLHPEPSDHRLRPGEAARGGRRRISERRADGLPLVHEPRAGGRALSGGGSGGRRL